MCCNCFTLGVIIGALNIIFYIAYSIWYIRFLTPLSTKHDFFGNEIIFAEKLLMIIASCLLVVGIVKRRYKLMLFWLILNVVDLVMICCIPYFYIYSTKSPFISYIIVGLQGLCFGVIVSLFENIRMESNDGKDCVVGGADLSHTPHDMA